MILSKHDGVALYHRSAFGNKLRVWSSLDDFRATAPRDGSFGLRAQTPQAPVHYGLSYDEVIKLAGYSVSISEMAPDESLLLQGEVMEEGWELRYSTTPHLRMREAMESASRAFGLSARMLLRQTLSPSSYEDLLALFDRFPGHIVEFSAYSMVLGDLRGRNTVIWEVRSF